MKRGGLGFRFALFLLLLAPLAFARFHVAYENTKFFYCIFKHATGIPCPFCNMTGSWVLMAKGAFADGFVRNPLGAVLFILDAISVIWLGAAMAFNFRELPIVAWFKKRAVWGTALFLLAANWAYSIWRAFG